MNRDFSRWLEWASESSRAISVIDPEDCASAVTWLSRQTLEKFLKATWIRLGDIPPVEDDAEDMNELALRFSDELSHNQCELLFSSIAFLEPFRATQYIEMTATPYQAREAVRVAREACGMLKSWLEART
jgi:HEPN domain-containing protein